MTKPKSTQARRQPEPPDDRRPDEGQTSTSQRPGSVRANRDLDVIPEGEDELTEKSQDELGEDEDEALERE